MYLKNDYNVEKENIDASFKSLQLWILLPVQLVAAIVNKIYCYKYAVNAIRMTIGNDMKNIMKVGVYIKIL